MYSCFRRDCDQCAGFGANDRDFVIADETNNWLRGRESRYERIHVRDYSSGIETVATDNRKWKQFEFKVCLSEFLGVLLHGDSISLFATLFPEIAIRSNLNADYFRKVSTRSGLLEDISTKVLGCVFSRRKCERLISRATKRDVPLKIPIVRELSVIRSRTLPGSQLRSKMAEIDVKGEMKTLNPQNSSSSVAESTSFRRS